LAKQTLASTSAGLALSDGMTADAGNEFLTSPGATVGTLMYMSPEQVRGKELDARTDLFSFGAVLYEMATGAVPFRGETSGVITEAILNRAPVAPVRLNPDLPTKLEEVINKALEKDRELRCQTAAELRGDLKRLKRDTSSDRRSAADPSGAIPLTGAASSPSAVIPAGGSSASITSAVVPPPAPRPLWKNPLFLAGAAGVLLIAVLALWKLRGKSYSAGPSAGEGEAEPMQVSQLTTTGDVTVGVISPDGKLVAYVREQHGKVSLWMLQLATKSTAQIAELATSATLAGGPRFSPDGNYLYYSTQAFGAPKATLYRVASLGGLPENVLDDVPSTIAFSPDGKRFAFIRQVPAKLETYLVTADADGTNLQVVATKKEPQAFIPLGPTWLRDGLHVAVVAQPNVARPGEGIEVVDLKTGTSSPLGNLSWLSMGRLSWRSNPDAIVFAGFEKLGDFRPQLWELLYPGGQLRKISNDLNSYSVPGLTADGSKMVVAQTLLRAGLWVAPSSNADAAKQITAGTSRDDGLGLTWIGNTQLVYGYLGGSNVRVAMLELPEGQPSDLRLPGEAEFAPASCSGVVVYVQVGKQSFSIWRAELNGGTPREVDPGPSSSDPACTPDGKFVFYERAEGSESRLMRVPATGGTPQKMNNLNLQHPTVSPDGRQIAAIYLTDPTAVPKLALMPAEGGQPTQVIDLPNDVNTNGGTVLAWMPDGRGILIPISQKGIINLWVQPVGAPQGKSAPPHQWTHFSANNVNAFAVSPDGKQVALARLASTTDIVLITHLP
jgi:eukaryotic-like serine/threonine-protein kinase